MNILTDGAKEYGKYPLGIYGEKLLLFATFLVPYALIQYYPFLYSVGRNDDVRLVFVPLLACLFLVPCYALWRYGVRHYKSSGS